MDWRQQPKWPRALSVNQRPGVTQSTNNSRFALVFPRNRYIIQRAACLHARQCISNPQVARQQQQQTQEGIEGSKLIFRGSRLSNSHGSPNPSPFTPNFSRLLCVRGRTSQSSFSSNSQSSYPAMMKICRIISPAIARFCVPWSGAGVGRNVNKLEKRKHAANKQMKS